MPKGSHGSLTKAGKIITANPPTAFHETKLKKRIRGRKAKTFPRKRRLWLFEKYLRNQDKRFNK